MEADDRRAERMNRLGKNTPELTTWHLKNLSIHKQYVAASVLRAHFTPHGSMACAQKLLENY